MTGLTDQDYTVRSHFYAPPSDLDGCFTAFYHLDLDVADGGVIEDYMHPEWGSIRFFGGSAPDAWLGQTQVSNARLTAAGPSTRPGRFRLGPSRMWGIGFLPLGWARFIESSANALANCVCDGAAHPAFRKFAEMSETLCDPTKDIERQLATIATTMRRLVRPCREEAKIVRVHTALVDEHLSNVSEFAEASGMSVRTLERTSLRYFGFPPKVLLRRQRFMRSLASFMLHKDSRWTEAMDNHYHDQAQFTREFREFMTMTPSEYAALDHPFVSSFMEARARQWGSAAQTLDKPTN